MENTQISPLVVSLKKQNFGLIIMLVLELLLGVAIGIFAKFPETGTKEEFWQYAMTQPTVIGHIILAVLIILAGALFAWKAYQSKESLWVKVSLVGFLALLVADGSGSQFIATQSDIFSHIMSLGFLVAFASYGVAWYKTK